MIIANNLNHEQVKYLSHRIKNGVEKDEIDKDDVLYLHKDSLPKLDTKDVFNTDRASRQIFIYPGLNFTRFILKLL